MQQNWGFWVRWEEGDGTGEGQWDIEGGEGTRLEVAS